MVNPRDRSIDAKLGRVTVKSLIFILRFYARSRAGESLGGGIVSVMF